VKQVIFLEITISIETYDRRQVVSSLFDREWANFGDEKRISDNATIKYKSEIFRKAEGVPQEVIIILTLLSEFAVSLAANWLYDKLKGKATKLEIELTEVEIDKDEIKRIIIEKVKKS